ncbi:DUF1534 domain-containing protein [Pseudomonas tremae]|nr:DUF1534 domain-containing protein [Pseudomonas tremae]MCF5807560.1 DUF1534 domain-containing protein [Pseudomonas tremae]
MVQLSFPTLQRGNAVSDALRQRPALRRMFKSRRPQVLNLCTRLSSSLDSVSRLLESARAASERSAISCASPWI